MTGLKTLRLMRAFLATALAALVASAVCAEGNPRDPYEGFNRTMYSVNEVIDTYAVRPLAKGYDSAVPLPVKASVGNMFGNVGDLWIGVNGALQGKMSEASVDFGRLLINSTVGIFGLFDVASELGFEKHEEDFGQTLAVWGVKDGGYLFWPLIGPRTVRDTAGFAVDAYIDPVSNITPISARNSMRALRIVDIRAGLLPADKLIDEAALDKYTYVRDAYLQRRQNQIYDGRPPRVED